jgi:hypothetical protein
LELPYIESKPDIIVRIKDTEQARIPDGLSRLIYKSLILAMLYDNYDDDEMCIEVPVVKKNEISRELMDMKEKK